MAFVEQIAIIRAPMSIIMEALNDVTNMPSWATVTGTIDNVQGSGQGMTYDWHYSINSLNFSGKSEIIEQTERTVVTKTTGDVESLWTINLAPVGKQSTSIRVMVEYSPPNIFVEILADLVLEQLGDPEVAITNMTRFKAMVEERARQAEEKVVVNP